MSVDTLIASGKRYKMNKDIVFDFAEGANNVMLFDKIATGVQYAMGNLAPLEYGYCRVGVLGGSGSSIPFSGNFNLNFAMWMSDLNNRPIEPYSGEIIAHIIIKDVQQYITENNILYAYETALKPEANSFNIRNMPSIQRDISNIRGYVVDSIKYYKNDNDGSYSITNPRELITQNIVIANNFKFNSVTTYYIEDNRYDNISASNARLTIMLHDLLGTAKGTNGGRGAHSKIPFRIKNPNNNTMIVGYPLMLSPVELETGVVYTGDRAKQISLFTRDQLVKHLQAWGIPFTFDISTARYNNTSEFPDYKPSGQPDNPTGGGDGGGNNYSDPMETVTPSISGIDVMSHSYAVDRTNMTELSKFLWGETFTADLHRVWTNPAEVITGVYMFPFDLWLHDPDNVGEDTRIQLGNVTAPEECKGRIIQNTYNRRFVSNTFRVERYYNSFLDFEPFSTYELYIPYVGIKQVSAADIIDHDIKVEYIISLLTGQATAQVYSDTRIIAVYNSQIGIPISLSSSNTFEQQQATAMSIGKGVVSIGAAVLTGGASVGAAGAAGASTAAVKAAKVGAAVDIASTSGKAIESTLNIPHLAIDRGGGYCPDNSLYSPQDIYLIATRHASAIPANMRNTIGYVSAYGGKISEFSGFLKCSDIKGGTSATDTENAMINELLRGGIYV